MSNKHLQFSNTLAYVPPQSEGSIPLTSSHQFPGASPHIQQKIWPAHHFWPYGSAVLVRQFVTGIGSTTHNLFPGAYLKGK
jgi:hypothetical protein